jgi:pimeloyl-ACP methyl ester carboxylesterase
VSELRRLLDAARIAPPYIVVGHSFGGYNMRLFADRYVSEVVGIVLVDSSHEDQQAITHAESPHADAEWAAFLTGLRHCHALALRDELGQRRRRAGARAPANSFAGSPRRNSVSAEAKKKNRVCFCDRSRLGLDARSEPG